MSIELPPDDAATQTKDAPVVDADAGGRNPEDISVAILYPGNRVEKVAVPLEASRMDVAIEPSDAYERDIVLADNADRDLGREVLRRPFHDAKLVYRMRGDLFRELELWDMHPVKRWAATNVVVSNVDGVIAVTDLLAAKFARRTGVEPVGSAGLCKDPTGWPTVDHTSDELRICTLTNVNYWRKVEPLVEWAPVVNHVLEETGGRWHICGDGTHSDQLRNCLAGLDNVHYQGYVDAERELAASNLMIHASRLDGQPNAILEGMASGLPVVTNSWPEFLQYGWPLDVQTDTDALRHTLEMYRDPAARRARGQEGIRRLERHHTPEAIARDYERYFAGLLNE